MLTRVHARRQPSGAAPTGESSRRDGRPAGAPPSSCAGAPNLNPERPPARTGFSLDHRAGCGRIGEIAARPPEPMVAKTIRPSQTLANGTLRRIGGCGAALRAARLVAAVLALALCGLLCAAPAASATQRFRADEWITECDGPRGGGADCSITVPFWQPGHTGKGSFALVVMLQTGNIGIVGQPPPQKAVLRVDKNPAIECRQAQYCIFPTAQALAIVKQLEAGSLILVDVYTGKSEFRFSLTPKGFQAGIAQIRAWGYRLPID